MTKKKLEKEVEKYISMKQKPITKYDLIAFAEPREKRIEELERKLEQTEKDLADYQFNYPTIKEVQEENKQAKEIIREMFHYIPSWTGEKHDKPRVYAMPDELRAKAEAFLKE